MSIDKLEGMAALLIRHVCLSMEVVKEGHETLLVLP